MNVIEPNENVPVMEQEINQEEAQIKNLACELIQKNADLKMHKAAIKKMEKEAATGELKELEKARKELATQIKNEKEKIKGYLFEDTDYKEAANGEIESKVKAKELQGKLKESLRDYKPGEQLSIFDLDIDGDFYKFQSQKTVDMYVNGKEIKL